VERSRYGFAGFWFLSLLAAWFLLRLALLVAFKPTAVPVTDILLALLSGFHRDIFAALAETIPLLVWMLIIPDRRFGSLWHRVLFIGACPRLLVRAGLPAVRLSSSSLTSSNRRFNTVRRRLPHLSQGGLHQHLGVRIT